MTCIVRGSVNVDDFFTVPRIVSPGETISSVGYSQNIGGKGANCSVAIAKSGTNVEFVGSVGDDEIASKVVSTLKKFGVGIDSVRVAEGHPTGRAMIQLSEKDGENSIVLLKGANFGPTVPLPQAVDPKPSHLIVQNEIPLQDTIDALNDSRAQNLVTIFNPSPMPTPDELLNKIPWQNVDWLVLNHGEAKELLHLLNNKGQGSDNSGEDEEKLSDDQLIEFANQFGSLQGGEHALSRNTQGVVITLGGRGVVARIQVLDQNQQQSVSTFVLGPGKLSEAGVKDTTGAGDCFTGYLSSALSKITSKGSKLPTEKQIKDAISISTQAAAICVESPGAMESVPLVDQVKSRIDFEWPSWYN